MKRVTTSETTEAHELTGVMGGLLVRAGARDALQRGEPPLTKPSSFPQRAAPLVSELRDAWLVVGSFCEDWIELIERAFRIDPDLLAIEMVLLEDPGRVDAADPDEVAPLVEPLLDLRVVDSLDLAVRIALNREPEPGLGHPAPYTQEMLDRCWISDS